MVSARDETRCIDQMVIIVGLYVAFGCDRTEIKESYRSDRRVRLEQNNGVNTAVTHLLDGELFRIGPT
jgi:hypothetical protein